MIDNMQQSDWEQVRSIYLDGIATGDATFETNAPAWARWHEDHLSEPRLVYREGGKICGWAALSPVSGRCVYAGVAEVSVYVAGDSRGRGVGRSLLSTLVARSEEAGIWTLQAGVFPENRASIELHKKCGFRQVGTRERLGQMAGVWRDVVLLERRSKTVGIEQKVTTVNEEEHEFQNALRGLEAGDFSRLEPLFMNDFPDGGPRCSIIHWYEVGLFAKEPVALAEALTCACFLGYTSVAEYLIEKGVDPSAGFRTGMNAFHWAANRGQLGTSMLLIRQKAPLEIKNMYGGTVLGTAVWSAVNEPRGEQLRIIEELIKAGARVEEAQFPCGDERVDKILAAALREQN